MDKRCPVPGNMVPVPIDRLLVAMVRREKEQHTIDLLARYHEFVASRDKNYHTDPDYLYAALGLAGETGEVVEVIKKFVREGENVDPAKRAALVKALFYEFGDVAWYLVRLGQKFGFSLAEILEGNIEKLTAREANGKEAESVHRG